MEPKLLTPSKQISLGILSRLELISTHVFPLAGGSSRRSNTIDPRLGNLQDVKGDNITYYEHFATIRDKKADVFYIAFRETPDALYARSQDPTKFPEWLMKTKEKLSECRIFIQQAYKHPGQVAILRSFEDWLSPIESDLVFDTIVYFLGKNNVLSKEILDRFR